MNFSVDTSNDSSLFGLSPPHDGSEADMMMGQDALFPDLMDGLSTNTDLRQPVTNGRHPSVSAINKKPIIQIKVPASQGTNFIKLITEKFDTESASSVLHLLQDGGHKTSALSPKSETSENSFPDSSSNPFESPCMSKNAIAARENRMKKKKYVDDLEQSVKRLRSENDTLNKQVGDLGQAVNSLNEEVRYLRAVLANQGSISALLKNIHNTQGVSVTSSVTPNTVSHRKRKRHSGTKDSGSDPVKKENIHNDNARTRSSASNIKNESTVGTEVSDDHSYANVESSVSYTGVNGGSTHGGVCLHVAGDKVSLEFCAHCSQQASSST